MALHRKSQLIKPEYNMKIWHGNESFFSYLRKSRSVVIINLRDKSMSKTQDDLRAAFAGESQANRKYLAFAKAAEKEGKSNLAKLFRAVADGETVHALKHLTNLGEVKDSAENLKAAIAGETYEIETMYPGFITDAQADGEKLAEIGFYGANEVEKIHQKEFIAAFSQIETGSDVAEQKYFVCQICGKLELGEAPEVCSICKAPKASFNEIK